jgi:hypothetical protein
MDTFMIPFIEVALVLGFLWVGIGGLFSLWQTDKFFFFRPVRQVEGVVTGHGMRSFTNNADREEDFFYAKFSFVDEAGKQVECSDQWGHRDAKPPVGTMVPVIHPIAFPEKARLKFGLRNSLDNTRSYFWSIFRSAVGLIGLYWLCTGDDRVKLWLATLTLKLFELVGFRRRSRSKIGESFR